MQDATFHATPADTYNAIMQYALANNYVFSCGEDWSEGLSVHLPGFGGEAVVDMFLNSQDDDTSVTFDADLSGLLAFHLRSRCQTFHRQLVEWLSRELST